MSVITLTSDYGLVDHRVASIKGKILSWSEDVKVVDITHNIMAYNLLQTAYIVRNAYKFFPEGSIHIISVDSFHHRSRKISSPKLTVIILFLRITESLI
jgi:S-adenosylmethionine hydrolase